MKKNLSGGFKKMDYISIAGVLSYSSIVIATPLCLVDMAKDLSFGLTEGGFLQFAESAFIFLILFFSGFFAGWWGKAASMGTGSLVIAAGLLLYATAQSYVIILPAMALIGFGNGIIEGLVTPLVSEQHPQNPGNFLNFVHGFWSVGIITTTLIVGYLLSTGVNWRQIFFFLAAFSAATGVLFLSFRGHEKHTPLPFNKVFKNSLDVLTNKRFYLLACAFFCGAGAEGGFTFWSSTFIRTNYAALPSAGGIGTAFFAGGMFSARILSGRFVPQNRLRRLLFGSAILGFVVSPSLLFITNIYHAYVILFLSGLSIACFWPSLQSLSDDCMDTDSTQLFILLSCAGIPGFGTISLLMGWIGDAFSLRFSFIVIPVLFLLFIVFLLLDTLIFGREEEKREREA